MPPSSTTPTTPLRLLPGTAPDPAPAAAPMGPDADGSGVEPSADEAYRTLAAPVLGYLRAQRAPDPEDLLGEVFFQVARDLHRFRGDAAALRRWVFSIAHNRLLDARRRESRRPRWSGGELPDGPAPAAPDPVDPDLVEALATLTLDQREVIVLRFVADLSIEDVARITKRRVGAVKALQHRALSTLGRLLQKDSPPPVS